MNIFARWCKFRLWRPKADVYSLVGASGTGKSFRAQLIAEKNQISYLIDDGLLIYNQAIIAGKSAKKEAVYFKAIKTALFDDAEHLREVRSTLRARKVQKILIIGTSDRMVILICERLGLPTPQHIIRIEDISSPRKIALAQRHRKEGKHVIPVPTVMLKLHYPTMLAHKIKVFIDEFSHRHSRRPIGFEKSIVRPDFQQGRRAVTVSEKALKQMILHCIDEFNSQIEVVRVRISSGREGYRLSLDANLPYGVPLTPETKRLQLYIIEHIEHYSGIIIEAVKVNIERVSLKDKGAVHGKNN